MSVLLPASIAVGDVAIRKGMCPGNNPYLGVEVENRREMLALLQRGSLPNAYEAWYAPPGGGALRIFNEDTHHVVWCS